MADTFGDFMISEAVNKNQEIAELLEQRNALREALRGLIRDLEDYKPTVFNDRLTKTTCVGVAAGYCEAKAVLAKVSVPRATAAASK